MDNLIQKRLEAVAAARAIIDADEFNEEAYRAAMAEAESLNTRIAEEQRVADLERISRESQENVNEFKRSQTKEARTVTSRADQDRNELREFLTPGSARTTWKLPFVPESRATTDPIISTDASATYASYVVPETIWQSVNLHVNAESGVLKQNVTVLRTTSGATLMIPTLTTDPIAALHAEAAASTANNFVLASPQLDAYRVDGHFLVSTEFLTDAIINPEAFLSDLAGRAIATQIAAYAAVGTGSGQPQGINDGTPITSAGVTSASATTFTMDDLIALRYSVLPGYANRGGWVCGDAAWLIIAKMKDDNGSYYLWQPSMVSGSPDTLLGKPIYADAGFEAPTSALRPVFFGDFSEYWTRWSHGGIEFSRDDSFAFTSFTSTFRYAAWWDAELLHPTLSIKHLLMAT